MERDVDEPDEDRSLDQRRILGDGFELGDACGTERFSSHSLLRVAGGPPIFQALYVHKSNTDVLL